MRKNWKLESLLATGTVRSRIKLVGYQVVLNWRGRYLQRCTVLYVIVCAATLPSFLVALTRPGQPTLVDLCCKVQTGKKSRRGAHLRGVYQVVRSTHLKSTTPSAVLPCVIMDCTSGSKRAAGDEHKGRVDTEVGKSASV